MFLVEKPSDMKEWIVNFFQSGGINNVRTSKVYVRDVLRNCKLSKDFWTLNIGKARWVFFRSPHRKANTP